MIYIDAIMTKCNSSSQLYWLCQFLKCLTSDYGLTGKKDLMKLSMIASMRKWYSLGDPPIKHDQNDQHY